MPWEEPIPEGWPPAGDPSTRTVPLFPLPHVWLFPYVVLPLRIFEPRYRQMIEDSLDGPGRIVLGTVQLGHEHQLMDAPPVYPVAGLGEIGRHKRLENGEFEVWLVGLQRVRVREVPSDRLYRKVEIEPAVESGIDPDREEVLREELADAIRERTESDRPIPPEMPVSHLADLLTLRMPLPHELLNELYSELDTEQRARRALEEHAQRPPDAGKPGPSTGFDPTEADDDPDG